MRKIRIVRPKHMQAGMAGLTVEVDGKKTGEKLKNGSEVVLSLDENAHELRLHGGMMAGKAFQTSMHIPVGNFSYSLRVDMLSLTNGYKPVLVFADVESKESLDRTMLLIGATLSELLMDDKLRDILRKLPDTRIRVGFGSSEWGVAICCGPERRQILKQPYSQTKGSLLGLAINLLEHADMNSPEGLEKVNERIFEKFLNHLPDYRRIGRSDLQLLG